MGGTALLIVAAAMLSQHVLYEWLVVPRLAGLPQASVAWRLGLAVPIALAALTSGWLAKSLGEMLLAAILETVGLQTHGPCFAQTGRPGWYK